MKNLILIKYGELTTKKDNRKLFINVLSNNIYDKLKEYNVNIIKDRSRMYIEFDSQNKDSVLNVINNTFGIHAFNFAYKVNTNINNIKDMILEILKCTSFKTFKVNTKRRDKSFEISSLDFNVKIGDFILDNFNDIKVDVHNPDISINIEINKEESYIYLNEIKGLGGYPTSVLGKGLLMLSGGIDSPVAGYLSQKRGVKISCLYFEALPHTSLNAREKVINLTKALSKYQTSIDLYIISITDLQEAIYKNIDNTYMITILRRMMYRIAQILADKLKCSILINGESIGQVASQTLTSMKVINEVVNIPVIRPLACFDKLEIIDIAKKIGTYDISILPYIDCCTVFVPKHPIINPKLDKCILYEKSIDYEKLIEEALNNIIKIKINENKKEFEDLL